MKRLKVVIPVYCKLKDIERKSVVNTLNKFEKYDIAFVVPNGMDTTELRSEFPSIELIGVSDKWIGPGLGVKGYNEMMMSESFYQLFSDYEYILICHTDAWVFYSDRMDSFLNMGYDIMAAPWVWRPRTWSKLKYKIFKHDNPFCKVLCRLFVKYSLHEFNEDCNIGNGGFSLRKVKSMLRVCREESDVINEYLSHDDVMWNEDVFWSKPHRGFRFPTLAEALSFAIDVRPWSCFQLNNHQLPMACHGFFKGSKRKFWKRYIEVL